MFMSRAAMTEHEVIREPHHVTGGSLKHIHLTAFFINGIIWLYLLYA